MRVLKVIGTNSCIHCRRPIEKIDGIGWLHAELAQYAHEELTCNDPIDIEGWRARRAAGRR